MHRYFRYAVLLAVVVGLLSSCGIRRHKYDNPISKDTQQPDKVLFDKAINDIERSRFEIARLTLQTLINTYDTSEYLAKAKLAIADSWFREGGAHGLAQAEAEYKDFILFYPTMEEAAEAQNKVCDIHYKQMEKSDRDPMHAFRAEDECRQLLVQFPNSKFAPEAQQKLRNIQEVLADHEFRVGFMYHNKGSYPAAANRFQALTDQFPLYSGADEALWELADSYQKMGDRFDDKKASALARIVKDYPLSAHADTAKDELKAMKRPIPEADPVAYSRMKYELENRQKAGAMSHVLGAFRKAPDTRLAAKSGSPTMDTMHPTVPASVPQVATSVSGDVGASTLPDSGTALDKLPDARANPPAASQPGAAAPPAGQVTATTPGATQTPAGSTPAADTSATPPAQGAAATTQPLPTNHPMPQAKGKKKKDKKKKGQDQQVQAPPAQTQADPASTTTPSAPKQ
jgi:outer membrane protein assembly factor BamD